MDYEKTLQKIAVQEAQLSQQRTTVLGMIKDEIENHNQRIVALKTILQSQGVKV